jgi:uncharacterized membrane protein
MLAVRFYDAITAVHVIAIVIAFGGTFMYPVLGPFLARNHADALPAFHLAQDRIGKVLITPFAVLALITGIYLAADADYFGEIWVQVPMAILIILLGMGGAVFSPLEQKSAVAAANPESAEYQALVKRGAQMGTLAGLLILVAIFFMVAKPGLG